MPVAQYKCKYTGDSTKRMGKLSSACEKADTSAACTLKNNEFHYRVGNSFPNCQQLYEVVLNLQWALAGLGTFGFF
jgi:hypothetical protein